MNPIRTIVKFHKNTLAGNRNALLTRTLLKIGVIDMNWNGEVKPQDGEFWIVDVVNETCPDQTKGCFILHPISKIEVSSISTLVPGMFTEEMIGKILHIKPAAGLTNPILPLKHKNNIKDIYAVIVHV